MNRSQLDGKVVQTAYIVRDKIEDVIYSLPKFNFDKDNLQGACGISSFTLSRCYNRLKVPHEFIMGWYEDPCFDGDENHCWIQLTKSKLIVDITATQFGVSQRVSIVKPGFPYLPSCKGDVALHKLKNWCGQAPQHYKDLLTYIENTTVQAVQNLFGK